VLNEQPTVSLLDRVARLRAAFIAIPMNETALKEAIWAYVDETRGLGWTIERVIVEVKRLAEVEKGPLFRALRDPTEGPKARVLIERAVTWCIDRYFGTYDQVT
jgi:hypothetical protein